MKRVLPYLALLALLLAAWVARVELATGRTLPGASPYAALDDAESAYRLRAVELTLAAGRAPRTDAFLGPEVSAGQFPALQFSPLVHSAVALTARQALHSADGSRELAGVEEHALEIFAAQVSPVLAFFAIGAAFAACGVLVGGARAPWAAIAGAAIIALAPTAIAGEALGTLRAQPWIELASFGALAAITFAWRAREPVDATLGALFAGLCSALALLAGSEAWPLPVAIGGTLIALALRQPREKARDAWRAVTLFTAVTAAIVAIAEPGDSLRFAAPDFRGGVQFAQLAFAGAGLPFACVALFPSRRDPVHAAILALSFLAFSCALFDTRFHALVHVALAASVALLVGAPAGNVSSGWSKLARPALAAAVVLAATSAWTRSNPREASVHTEFVDGLLWLRNNSASPGPFNNAQAQQDWRVWTAPRLAGSIAYHARRPVLEIASNTRDAGELAVADALLKRLDETDVLYVIATPCMLRDATLMGSGDIDASSALASFALGRVDSPPSGWECVWQATQRITPAAQLATNDELAGPVASIWRRVSALPGAGAGPSVR